MEASRGERKQLVVQKARAELDLLAQQGVLTGGNAFSQVMLLKGEASADELAKASPLCGADGIALHSALTALGYAPEDWCALLSVDAAGVPLDPQVLRQAICALDPATIIVCDEAAAQALREAYADELVTLDDFEAAMLAPGKEVRLLGMRVMALGGFATALNDAHQKQVMWARLKRLPPLGEPY